MNKWTVDEVCHFLAERELEEEVIELFRTNKIKGRVLAMLNDDDLKHLGVAALGDRKYLLHIFKETGKNDYCSSTVPIDNGNIINDDEYSIYNEDKFIEERTSDVSESISETVVISNECLGSSKDTSMSTPSKSQKNLIDASTASPVIIISDNEAKPIPDPFPFPATYSANVDVALHKGNLCPATTAHFYTRIAGIMSIYTIKPTKEEYTRVAQAILKKYPFVGNPLNPEGNIITNLRRRFREMRRYTGDPCNKPSIVKKLDEMPPTKKIKTDGKYKVREGEDMASFARHNSQLKIEARKTKPNRSMVTELMSISFAMRRNNIIEDPKPLNEVLIQYPFLKDRDEMIAELGRMNNKMNIRGDFLCQWTQQWLPKIIAIIKENTSELNKKRMKPFLDIEKDLNDNNAANLTIKALYALSYMLKDHKMKPLSDKLMTITPVTVDLEKITSDIVEPAPTLLIIGHLNVIQDIFLVAEKEILCSIKPVEAPLSLLAAFYSYNMNFPKGLEPLYGFLEYAILDKKPKKNSSCLSVFITSLKNSKV